MMTFHRILLVLLSLAACSSIAADAPDGFHDDKLSALDAAIEQAVTDGRIVGAALWVSAMASRITRLSVIAR